MKRNPYTFTEKSAVVTGAASGIGAALAHDLAARGSALALVDQNEDGLARVARTISDKHPNATVTVHTADLSRHDDFADLARDIRSAHPSIGLLINNAGVALGGMLDEVSLADFDWIMSINFRAPVALVKQFLPDLRRTPGAHIVNVSSLFGLIGPAGQAPYSASKFALRGFTLALQSELIPQGIGVTVVHPGGVATNIAANARLGSESGGNAARAEQMRAQISSMLTLSPEDAASQILRAVHRRNERLVITRQAKSADRIVRLLPVRQRGIIARSMNR